MVTKIGEQCGRPLDVPCRNDSDIGQRDPPSVRPAFAILVSRSSHAVQPVSPHSLLTTDRAPKPQRTAPRASSRSVPIGASAARATPLRPPERWTSGVSPALPPVKIGLSEVVGNAASRDPSRGARFRDPTRHCATGPEASLPTMQPRRIDRNPLGLCEQDQRDRQHNPDDLVSDPPHRTDGPDLAQVLVVTVRADAGARSRAQREPQYRQ